MLAEIKHRKSQDIAIDRTFSITISAGVLNLNFTSVANYAKVSAIKVVPATGSPTPTPTPGPVACSQYTSSSAIPTDYGSPYDVVSSPSTNLIKATCDTTSAKIDLGRGDPLQYIYNQGYLFKTGGTNWSPVSYTSTEQLISNAWYPKSATTNISLTSTELAQPSYALAYLCTWTGSTWKCGCRGCKLYTVILADSVIQAIKDGKLTKERKDKAPGT
jgi:hypothetical protein